MSISYDNMTNWLPHDDLPCSYLQAKSILLERAKCNQTIFRGQKNHNWGLISSLARVLQKKKWTDSKGLAMENESVTRFCEECIRSGKLKDSLVNSLDDLELKAFAQHYGLATRLLDWSYSPYIALFFAFDGFGQCEIESEYVAVWSLDWGRFEQGAISLQRSLDLSRDQADRVLNRYYSSKCGVQLVNHINSENERQRSQKGVFTHINFVDHSLESFIIEYAEFFAEDTLVCVKIHRDEQKTVLSDLQLMGIEPSSVMGGIDGVAHSIFNNHFRFM